MITRIEAAQITQECENCKAVIVHLVAVLSIGAGGDPNMIALPPCSNCAAQEFLNRTVDNDGKHAEAVNSLHATLAAAAKFPVGMAARIAALPATRFTIGAVPFDVPRT